VLTTHSRRRRVVGLRIRVKEGIKIKVVHGCTTSPSRRIGLSKYIREHIYIYTFRYVLDVHIRACSMAQGGTAVSPRVLEYSRPFLYPRVLF
jgi:hypothetical protein